MSMPHAAQAAKPRLHSLLNATFVTLRRVAALCVLALVPGVALATTFTDTSGGGSFNVASSPLGGRAGCNLIPGAHPYASRTLTTNNTTTYKFTVTSSTGFGNDPFLAVYLGTFDPANPTANLIACNDDANGTLLPEFEALLNASTTYTVVTTSYSTGVGGSATYNITPDVTLAGAPLLSAVSVSGITTNTAVLQGTSNSAGTGYFVVQAAAQAAPSVAQVIAGQQSSGGAALSSGNGVMTANTSRTFNLASLQPGTAYTAYLVVRDNQTPQLTSVPSAANLTTVAIAPQAPVIGTATAGDAQATVAFTPPTNNGGSAITGYTVTSSPGGITATGSTSPITVTGLTNGTSYTFVVTATNSIGNSVNSAASNAVVPVGPAALTNFGPFARTFGDAPSAITAPTSASTGAFTYSSSNPAVATISGDVVTVVSAGTTVITANQAANGAFTAGSTTANLVVAKANPTLSGFNDDTRVFGDAPFNLVAPSSNSPGAITYSSSNPAVATISGSTVTLVGAGSTTLTASQAATANYEAGNATAQLLVTTALPALGAFADLTATFSDAPASLVAPTSPSAGAFTYTSSNPAVATISGNVVTFTGAGTSTITAIQAADGNYAAAQATAQLTVGVAAPPLSNFNGINATFGDAPITLVAPTSPSAGGFTYTSSNPAVATISGNVLTIVGSGSAIVTASQAAAGNYSSASITAPLNVGVGAATLSDFDDLAATFGDAPITLAAPTSPSAGAFTYTSSNPAVATITGNVVTIIGAGTASITAIQAADGNYGTAQITAQLVVATAVPTLGAFADLNATFGDAPITLTAPTSPSAGGFTYSSSNPAVATISGNTVTIVGSGTTTLTAAQAANGNYAAAQTSAQLQVGVAAPVLSNFGNLSATFGDAPITLAAPTSPSAGAFTYTSSNPAVATISGNVLTVVGSGVTTITATQAADGNYAGAQITAQLSVDTLAPSLTGFDDLSATYGQASFVLVAPTSPSAGAFTYTSSDPSVATINGNTVTVVGTGTTTLTAMQAANGSYAGASITAQLVVGAATPTITGFGDLHKVYGQAAFDLVDPASNSSGAFTYTIDNAAVATVSGRTVTITGAGTATITATQAATANYTAASVTALLVVDSRPDPTQDAEVVSGLQAQMDTAQRFADAQQGNVRDRLRQRRGTDAAGTANGLSINSTGGDGGVALKPELLEGSGASKAWSFWTGGAISTGERKARGNNDGYDFRSDGVTFGADKRFGKDVLLGVAVGGGWSDADVGANGSTVDAKQRALTVYGLWHASDSLFVDGQLAVGKLDYDLRRWSAIADTMGLAQRDGSQVFGSVTFGYESTHESRRLTSYGRVDAGRTTLDAYRETGLGIYDLDYREQTVDQRSVAVGLEGSHSVQVDWARDVRPYWQLEYRNDFSARSDAGINYVVAPADEDYRLSLKPWASSNWNVGFGADFAFGNGVIVTALLRHEVNVGMGSNTTVGLQFSLDFDGNPNAGSAGMQDATLQVPQAASKK
ncbi:MAG: autotransporter domain-containing protein [Lysobacteraceae bacterium]|nr:MAG: autotransporter domain-containing protein [Xanthomonadaceae bacterium]